MNKRNIIIAGVLIIISFFIYSTIFGEQVAINNAFKEVRLSDKITLIKQTNKSLPINCFDNCPTNAGKYYYYSTTLSRTETYSSLEKSFKDAGYEIRESTDASIPQSKFVAWNSPVSFIIFIEPLDTRSSNVSEVIIWGQKHV
jgi:hypothetical protein